MMNRLEDEEMPDPSEFVQSRNGVDFIPSSMMLSAVDSKLRMEMGSEKMLTGILEPLLEYAPENKACKAYRNLAEEVVGDES